VRDPESRRSWEMLGAWLVTGALPEYCGPLVDLVNIRMGQAFARMPGLRKSRVD
jgi:hypothetical protein